MKDYTVTVTEKRTVEVTATAPSAETAIDMVRVVRTHLPIIEKAPNAKVEIQYSVCEKEPEEENDECDDDEFDDDECDDDDEYDDYECCPACPLYEECHPDDDEENLIDEIC